MSAVRQLHGRPTPLSMSGAPEVDDTMQNVVRVEQRTAMCQSMCSEPLSSTSNDQDVHGTSEWPLLPPKLDWQQTEAVFVNKEPFTKLNCLKTKELK